MTAAKRDAVDPDILQRAGLWWARLNADDVSEADRVACEQWRQEHADHERAWQGMMAFDNKLLMVPTEVARHVLQHDGARRRHVRRQLLGLAVAGAGVGAMVYHVRDGETWHRVLAAYRSGTGEIRHLTLQDGTQLVLGSGSAVDVEYSATQRRILLRAGHIMVTTAADNQVPARPLSVQTRHGDATALGTRFAVSLQDQTTWVEVFEGAVLATPRNAPGQAVLIEVGQVTQFDSLRVQTPTAGHPDSQSWTNGMLSVSGMRLEDMLSWLGRYRSGIVRCEPAVADLLVTGVFPLHDTDRALHNLTLALPVRVSYRTRYWVTVGPVS